MVKRFPFLTGPLFLRPASKMKCRSPISAITENWCLSRPAGPAWSKRWLMAKRNWFIPVPNLLLRAWKSVLEPKKPIATIKLALRCCWSSILWTAPFVTNQGFAPCRTTRICCKCSMGDLRSRDVTNPALKPILLSSFT